MTGLIILLVFLGLLWVCAGVLGDIINEVGEYSLFAAIVVIIISVVVLMVGLALILALTGYY